MANLIRKLRLLAGRLYRIPELGFPRLRIRQTDDFDQSLGVETAHVVRFPDTASANVVHGVRYQPSEVRLVEWALASCGVDFERTTFVDVGCGKGRVLILAARKPFARIIGFDYSEKLLAVCHKNLRHLGLQLRCEVQHADALDFSFPDGNLLLFFYNPFHSPLLEQVLERVRRIESPVTLIFLGPERRALGEPWLFKTGELEGASVYVNQYHQSGAPCGNEGSSLQAGDTVNS